MEDRKKKSRNHSVLCVIILFIEENKGMWMYKKNDLKNLHIPEYLLSMVNNEEGINV